MKPIQVYLEEKEVRRLKQEALDRGITLSDLVRLYLLVKQRIVTKAGAPQDAPIPEKILKSPKTKLKIITTPEQAYDAVDNTGFISKSFSARKKK